MEHGPAGTEVGLLALREAGIEFRTARGRRRLRGAALTRIEVRDGKAGIVVRSDQGEIRYDGPDLGVWIKRVVSARRGRGSVQFQADESIGGWGKVTVATTGETAWLCASRSGVVLLPERAGISPLRWSWGAVEIDAPAAGKWRLRATGPRGTVTVSGEGVAAAIAARHAGGDSPNGVSWTLSVERRWGPMHLSGRLAVGRRGVAFVPTSSMARLGGTEVVRIRWSDVRRIEAENNVVTVEGPNDTLTFRTAWTPLLQTELARLRWQAALADIARARDEEDPDVIYDLTGPVKARQQGEPWRWGVLSVGQDSVLFRPAGGGDDDCITFKKDGMHCTRLDASRRPTLALANAKMRLEVLPAEGAPFVETFERISGIASSRFRARPGKLRMVKWMLKEATHIVVRGGKHTWELDGDAIRVRERTLSLDTITPPVPPEVYRLHIEVSGPEGLFRFSAPIVGRVMGHDLTFKPVLGLPRDIAHHELRRDRRVEWELPAWIDRSGKSPDTRLPSRCSVRDISPMGMAVEGCGRMTVGQEVGIAIKLQRRMHTFTGRVVRRVERGVWAFVFIEPPAALVHSVLRKSRADERARLYEEADAEQRREVDVELFDGL